MEKRALAVGAKLNRSSKALNSRKLAAVDCKQAIPGCSHHPMLLAMAGWLHGVFVGDWLFVFPLCGFSLSLFCNYSPMLLRCIRTRICRLVLKLAMRCASACVSLCLPARSAIAWGRER